MIKEVEVKSIISKTKNPFAWFGVVYNTNFYRGCPHNCIYCDSRSECYQIENFNDLLVKINAPLLMEETLSKKRKGSIGTIGTGAMSDPYNYAEKKYRITRKCLEVIKKYEYPALIITKSDLVLDDIDLLDEINKKTRCTVIFTVTTIDENLAKIIEPNAPSPLKRLEAMQLLSERGIYTGVLLMPILPFINDTKENIKNVVCASSYHGAKFIIPMFGVTLRDRQREYYYKKLDEHFPNLKESYMKKYKNNYVCMSKNYRELNTEFKMLCRKYNVIFEMKEVKSFEKINSGYQLGLFDI